MNRNVRNVVGLFILINLLLPACRKNSFTDLDLNGLGGEEVVAGIAGKSLPEHVPNELLVKFKTGITPDQRNTVLGNLKAEIRERIYTKAMQSAGEREGLYLLRIPVDVLSGMAQAQRLGEVEYAEPNYIYQHQATSDDPYYTGSNLWGMYGSGTSPSNSFGISAGTAWANNKTGSSAVCVGIIDEGFMFNHTDLYDNAWVNPNETVNGRDDDGNGYVDDIRGWDFVKNDNTTFDGWADDHGTHVAGTIGAKGGNKVGVAGVCWNVKMISAKFLGNNGGTLANAVKAVDYITDLKKNRGINIVASNNSWGGGGYSSSLYNAITRANAEGILFVAAAGNSSSNNDASPAYPASYNHTNIIAVASITSSGALSSFSNYGATTVDIGAPGSGIYSTLPATNGGSTYGSYSGTSMATPHVTGACALYRSINPSHSMSTVKSAVLNGLSTSSLSGKCVSGKRLNVAGF